MPKNKNYEIVKEYYINRREPEACDFYNKWMTHKYRHTMTVVKVGREIIKNDHHLSVLPKDIRDSFLYACLFHDLARAYEIDHVTGSSILKNHGLQAAKKLWELGETSLYILLPVLVHDQLNSQFLYLSLFELENIEIYDEMTKMDKRFLQDMRNKFWTMNVEERRVIEQGIRLVRDADILANLREFERMFLLKHRNFDEKISPIVEKYVESGLLIRREHCQYYEDNFCNIISWGAEVYYSYSLKCILDEKIFERIRQYLKDGYIKQEISVDIQEKILNIIDKGIESVSEKIQTRIK